MTLIRTARPEDAKGILSVLNPIIAETAITFSPTQVTEAELFAALADHQRRNDPFFVADMDGVIAGYAKYGPFRAGDGYAHTAELTIHLSPTARGRGLGRRMFNALHDHASAAGIHSLMAGISAENAPAIAFHGKLGLKKVGLIPQAGYKFGRFIDLVLMQKFV
ncbi:GNAT family N-acetyltransferase [Litoreibacter halocynthiae]|uniref:GNAT family N-acetyltransferase n=1 Tax=Litoreibacter halocynthiae TaxID=1242689 RepID=UPI00248F8770|nr:GNAT family N-acetyltransferase [Litoreibacter halocynthiae]